jgi:hypothetical protein
MHSPFSPQTRMQLVTAVQQRFERIEPSLVPSAGSGAYDAVSPQRVGCAFANLGIPEQPAELLGEIEAGLRDQEIEQLWHREAEWAKIERAEELALRRLRSE